MKSLGLISFSLFPILEWPPLQWWRVSLECSTFPGMLWGRWETCMFGADKPRAPFAGFQLRCPSCQKREVPLDGSTVD